VTDIYIKIQDICLNFPEVSERMSHGQPAFFVRGKKTLTMFRQDGARFAIWCPSSEGAFEQWSLVMPGEFFVPPYMGAYGWIGVNLAMDMDWGIVSSVLRDAYVKVAPKFLSKKLLAHSTDYV